MGPVKSREANQFLEILGVETDSREMKVLKAIIKAAGGLSKLVTFEEIFHYINSDSNTSYSKAWVYKCLKNLENAGFITVASIGNPKQFIVTEHSIMEALARKKQERVSILQKEREVSLGQRHNLDTANIPKLAKALIDSITKELEMDSSTIIEGADNIRRAIASEICSLVKPEDIIRTTSYLHLAESGSSGPAEEMVLRTVFEGVQVRGLIIPSIPADTGLNLLGHFLEKLGKTFIKAISTGNLNVKIANENLLTYRMICLNSERMILHLTNTIGCGAAALFHRKDNSSIIDDAITTFDELWSQSIDITEKMTTFLPKT